ncbi:MAG: hypothetical protein EA350_02950 [Gemmatimonadales bacterium]|nr:MAG: hypothetical protein EA350_02950 [Gemmatimonadales bacterium]
MRNLSPGLLLLLAFVSVGCDAPAVATSAPEPTVADSAGVQILRFPASALEVSAPRQLAPDPAVRIGVVEGPAEYQWTRPMAAVRLPDGGFAVAEGTPAEIRVFDAGGTFVRRIGRPGEGPGEFRSPQALARGPDGSILAWDARTRRRSHFAADGTLLAEATLQDLGSLRSISRAALLPDGRLVVIGGTGGPDAVANRGQAREPLEIRAIASPAADVSGAGGPESLRIGPLLGMIAGDEEVVSMERNASGNVVSIMISGQWYWGKLFTWASPGGVWAADRVGVEARHYRAGADGGLDRVIRVDGAGPRVTRALTDSVEALEVGRWERQMGDELTPEIRTMIRDDMAGRDYPETFPAMDAVFADARGNPWIGLPNPPSPWLVSPVVREVPRWLVFGGAAGGSPGEPAAGLHLLGVIHLPPGSHPLWADDEGVLLVRIDPDLGVPYIEWYAWVDG